MKTLLLLPPLLALAACDNRAARWEGYALRDRPGEDGTRLIGAYATAASCRDALLASASDPASEALVCGRGCPRPRDGLIAGCAATEVVRAADARAASPDASLTPVSAPPAGAARSPDNDPSPR